ncbi:hypothetical protein [Pantoea rodasii]|nr:hypothetical protein [Pantoea rodasii]
MTKRWRTSMTKLPAIDAPLRCINPRHHRTTSGFTVLAQALLGLYR